MTYIFRLQERYDDPPRRCCKIAMTTNSIVVARMQGLSNATPASPCFPLLPCYPLMPYTAALLSAPVAPLLFLFPTLQFSHSSAWPAVEVIDVSVSSNVCRDNCIPTPDRGTHSISNVTIKLISVAILLGRFRHLSIT